jgi:hypothetical protein
MSEVKNGLDSERGVSGNRPEIEPFCSVGDGPARPLACAGLSR